MSKMTADQVQNKLGDSGEEKEYNLDNNGDDGKKDDRADDPWPAEIMAHHVGNRAIYKIKCGNRTNDLDWIPQAVVLLNDALFQHPGVVGWVFFSSVPFHREAYQPETEFLAGPAAYFVPCHRPEEAKRDWQSASFEAKLQLASDTLLCHWVDDLTEAMPIWALDSRHDSTRTVRHWPTSTLLEHTGCTDVAAQNETGKPQGVVLGKFKEGDSTRLFCSRADECFDRTSPSAEEYRVVKVEEHQQWMSDQLISDEEDVVMACLRRMDDVAINDIVDRPQTITYNEARVWAQRAPLRKDKRHAKNGA